MAPALADGRFSVLVSPIAIYQSSEANDLLGQVGLGYDFGPSMETPVDTRVRLDVNEFFGSGSGDGVFSIGVSARTTKPLYLGGGLSIDTGAINGIGNGGAVIVGGPIPSDGFARQPATTNTELGVNLFVGQKLISRPGFGLDLEASYRLFPFLGDNFNQGVGIGIRTSF